MSRHRATAWAILGLLGGASYALAAGTFVNFETPHVHPLDLSPDRNTLASGDGRFHAGSEALTLAQLTGRAAAGRELTFTVVPHGSADLIAGSLREKRRRKAERRSRPDGLEGVSIRW